jgi:nucleotide-binding universal stress UspA family protein
MQKILFVTDALRLNTNTIDFAVYIAKTTQSKLVGIFLDNLKYESTPQIREYMGAAYVESIVSDEEQSPIQKEAIKNNINVFREYCKRNDITGTIHLDKGMPIIEAIAESRYADLIIVDPATTFAYHEKGFPTKFVRDLLMQSECPVIVAPDNFEQIDEVVFTYDGSASSVFAIKQFTYLLPQFVVKQITLLHVKEHENDSFNGENKINEWLKIHYPAVVHQVLSGDAGDELFKNFWGQSNKLIVMGAYGRSKFATLFDHSTADKLLKTVDTPVFISHL